MRAIVLITQRELKRYFDSLIAYILLGVFLGLSGFFTWLYGMDIFKMGEASLRVFFSIAYWTLFFFIPAITMGMIAQEKKSGTMELLLTYAVTDWKVVMGKFLAALTLIVTALLFTFPYVWTVSSIGNLDEGATICGYLALTLMSAAYISIGLLASSLAKDQIVAFLIAILIAILFHTVFDVMARSLGGFYQQLFSYLSVTSHYNDISRGVIDSKNIIYLLSLTFLGLFLTEAQLAQRKN
ncbi:MAG: ABC transporter permease subunit [Flavobacteriales bacterium]